MSVTIDSFNPATYLTLQDRLDARPRQRVRRKTPKKPLTPAQKAHVCSPQHIQRLIAGSARYREEHGGKPPTRKGIPNGWAGKSRRRLRRALITQAEEQAQLVVETLVHDGVLDNDEAGNAILAWAVSIVLAVDDDGVSAHATKSRLEAARLVLTYCCPRPGQGRKVSGVSGAMQFLEGLLRS